MKVAANLAGIDDFRNGMATLQARVKAAIGERLRQGAEGVAEAARARVGEGALAESIAVEDGEDGVRVVVGASYAAFVEFGTRRAPARPFLTPALAERRADIVTGLGEDLR
jgi:HK97 gp10 family phage protein